ncbi:MAG: VWA domain-containing protein [Actinomycetota bacterium]|nr:MAG: VWA domain-containing protein [Actinomycetota bacterium]
MREFPFVAVVGQDQLKMSLLLNAIDPRIGGVLIRGDKGSGKSTLARALADLLPDGAPFIEVPAGATEDRVKGSVDLAQMVSDGTVASTGGLLAEANGGVLYVDEVNLLADHIVDLLLDAAASGVNRIERDGVSAVFPAKFVLIGSMNPEEGELRPQLLDRFGLSVQSDGIVDPEYRSLALFRRLEFDSDPDSFCNSFDAEKEGIKQRLSAARSANLNHSLGLSAHISKELFKVITQLCISYGAQGLRADLTMARSAAAHASLDGRSDVEARDIEAVAPLVLSHRARKDPLQEYESRSVSEVIEKIQRMGHEEGDEVPASKSEGSRSDNGDLPPDVPRAPKGQSESAGSALTFGNGGVQIMGAVTNLGAKGVYSERVGGGPKGATPIGYRKSVEGVVDRRGVGLNVVGTLTSAVTRRSSEAEVATGTFVDAQDIVMSEKIARQGRTILVGLDLSGSIGMNSRTELASTVIESLLLDAYQTRDRVGVIVIAEGTARLLQKPTRSVEIIRAKLATLVTGGVTPLAKGIDLLALQAKECRFKGEHPFCILITDGRATGGEFAFQEAIQAAENFSSEEIQSCLIDIEDSQVPIGLAGKIAKAMGSQIISNTALFELIGRSQLRDALFG